MSPAEIDWTGIAAWGGGLGTVLGTIGGAIWYGVRSAAKAAASSPPKITQESTRVITTDSLALQQVAAAVEGLNVTLGELRAAIDQLRHAAGNLEQLGQQYVRDRQEERTEQEIEAEVQRRFERELERERRARRRVAPRRKPTPP